MATWLQLYICTYINTYNQHIFCFSFITVSKLSMWTKMRAWFHKTTARNLHNPKFNEAGLALKTIRAIDRDHTVLIPGRPSFPLTSNLPTVPLSSTEATFMYKPPKMRNGFCLSKRILDDKPPDKLKFLSYHRFGGWGNQVRSLNFKDACVLTLLELRNIFIVIRWQS